MTLTVGEETIITSKDPNVLCSALAKSFKKLCQEDIPDDFSRSFMFALMENKPWTISALSGDKSIVFKLSN